MISNDSNDPYNLEAYFKLPNTPTSADYKNTKESLKKSERSHRKIMKDWYEANKDSINKKQKEANDMREQQMKKNTIMFSNQEGCEKAGFTWFPAGYLEDKNGFCRDDLGQRYFSKEKDMSIGDQIEDVEEKVNNFWENYGNQTMMIGTLIVGGIMTYKIYKFI